MKKILALVLALVLSLSLASVAFAAQDIIPGGELSDDSDNPFHKPDVTVPEVAYGALLSFWGCFDDTGWQTGTALIENGLVGKDGKVINFPATVKWDFVITEGSEYVAKFDIAIPDAKDATEAYIVDEVSLAIVTNDPVIAVNKYVKGYLYAYDANALDTEYLWACDFEIELRNHYIDVITDAKLAQNNASFNNQYTRNDLVNALKTKAGVLFLEKHFGGANSSLEPAYVITTAQFDTLPAFTAAKVAYKDLVEVAFADAAIQTGLNFKYEITKNAPTKAELYANPAALPTVAFDFLSADAVSSATTITFAPAFLKDVKATIGAADIYLYVNGEYYGAYDEAVALEAGDVLGSYFFTAEAPVVEEEKENVGTGASDMTSVCVALAVVSLVAAGAVCVKKVSK